MWFFLYFLHVIWHSGVNIESPWEEPQAKRPDHQQWVQQFSGQEMTNSRAEEDPEMFWAHFKACEVKPDWLEDSLHLHWPETTSVSGNQAWVCVIQDQLFKVQTCTFTLTEQAYWMKITVNRLTSVQTNQLSREKPKFKLQC